MTPPSEVVTEHRFETTNARPPYRRGVDEIVETAGELSSESGLSARVEMAGANTDTGAPPTLVDNVETLAHVAVTLAEGADWFRELGTDDSPGTVLCTVSGAVVHAGVGEFAMGTPLREIIDTLGGGTRDGRGLGPGAAKQTWWHRCEPLEVQVDVDGAGGLEPGDGDGEEVAGGDQPQLFEK